MVWSDQSQFPFYVIDNNGNTILIIDQTGLHLVGPAGTIDGLISGAYPAFEFSNAAATANSKGDISYVSGGGVTAFRFAVLNNVGSPVGQYYIDDIGNGFLYTKQDLVIESDTNVRLHQMPSGPEQVIGGAAIAFHPTAGGFTTWVEYNVGQNAFLVGGVGSGWTAFPYNVPNGWHDLGLPYSNLQYGRAPNGNVRLRGVTVGGTKTDGIVMGTLPTGFWPPQDKIINVATATAGAVLPTIRIRAANGNVECWGQAASTNGAHSWDEIEFERF